MKYASREAILRLFNEDYGRSVYLLPMAERRKALLRMTWIQNASICACGRITSWCPITERKPVAFVKVPADGITRWALIDPHGVILDPPQKAVFQLPVLTGISLSEAVPPSARAASGACSSS